MSDEENGACFLEDVRVKFVAEKVCDLLQLESQTWKKSAASENFQELLQDFFEKGAALFFSSSKKRGVVASKEVSLSQKVD